MEIINTFFIILIFLIGGSVVLEDIKKRKIRNKVLLVGFFFGCLIFFYGWSMEIIDAVYLRKVLLNTVIGFLVGYLIWNLRLWPAGDAKFFGLLVFLLPLENYWKSYLPIFPSFSLLVNIFIPVFLALLLEALLDLAWKMRNPMILFHVGLFKCKYYYNYYIKGKDLRKLLKKISDLYLIKTIKNILLGLIFFGATYFFLSLITGEGAVFSKKTIFYLIASAGISFLVRRYVKESQEVVVPIEKISTGMALSATNGHKHIFKEDFFRKLGPVMADGITKSQVGIIKKFCLKNGINSVAIHKCKPFSPWIIFGVLITILLKNNLFQVLMAILGS